MKYLFADTANLEDIKFLNMLSLIQGVTTNPSIVAKEPKQNFEGLIDNLWEYCSNENLSLSVEVFSDKVPEIIKQANQIRDRLLGINKRPELLYIKIPIGQQEIQAIKIMAQEGFNINCTCCYTAEQMMLAIMSGAKYVSIFYNRLIDYGGDPLREIKLVKNFILENESNCKIIAGSIRKTTDFGIAWAAGTDIITSSPKLISDALYHEKSIESVSQFLKDFSSWADK